MIFLLSPGHMYAVTTDTGCTVSLPDGAVITIIAPHGTFAAPCDSCVVSDRNAKVQLVF